MERTKRGKINLDGNDEGETSSSSLCLSLGQSQSQVQLDTETESESSQGSKVNGASLNDLPPQILMEILNNVDTCSLFDCRFVNRQWNEISSGILHERSDAKILFHFEDGQFYKQRTNTEQDDRSFNHFLTCMKKSKNVPVAHFAFSCKSERFVSGDWRLRVSKCFKYSNFFGHEDWQAFLLAVDKSNRNKKKNQSQRIKMKSLELKFEKSMEPFPALIENLRNLLLNKILHLEEFGLDISEISLVKYPEIKLFPETAEHPMAQLAHLKVIRLNLPMISNFPGILKDLLDAAVNLEKIYLYKSSYNLSNEIYFLHSVGKLHLLKAFFVNEMIFSQLQNHSTGFNSDVFNFKLEELELGQISNTNDFLSSLFESTKDSLKKFVMTPLENLNRLQFPTFKNLFKLTLQNTHNPRGSFFPRGIRSLDIFPAVLELDLTKCDLIAAFPHLDSIPIFPKVQNLSVNDIKFTRDSIPVLYLLCPNLKHLKIHRDTNTFFTPPQTNLFLAGPQIWTHSKQLESLEIDIDVDSPENNPTALDSCFTGISPENCFRLHPFVAAKKTLEKWGSQAKIPESELTAERKHPSILDMTNLKTLKINAYTRENNLYKLLSNEDFFTDNLTCVSEEYAFKFLPHLKPQPKPKPKSETKINLDNYEQRGTSSSFFTARPSLPLSVDQNQNQTQVGAELGPGSKFFEASLNNFPPEMLTEIFKCVDTRSLFNCRLINRQWREISTGILHERSDAKITFMFNGSQFFQKRGNTQQEKATSLKDFLTCMKSCKNCPVVRFAFVREDIDTPCSFFSHEDWESFVSAVDESNKNQNQNQNQVIKVKSLEFKFDDVCTPFSPMVRHLRDLLLKKLPNLEEFGLKLQELIQFQEDSDDSLFPESVANPVAKFRLDSLQHLKVIHFYDSMIFNFNGILKELLDAAVNLKKIYLYESTANFSFEVYDFLMQVGEFDRLKTFSVCLNDDFFSQVERRSNFARSFHYLELEELKLDNISRTNNPDQIDPQSFLSGLFESSKNSLKNLSMAPLGHLDRLQFPTFKNLTNLKLQQSSDPQEKYFPRGVRPLDIFPAVRKLDLPECDLSAAFPHVASTPIFPRAQNLFVSEIRFTRDSIRILFLLCPNLKNVKLHKNKSSAPQLNFLEVGRQIWTLMKQLESLEIDIDVNSPENNSTAVDSCFTGISLENVQRLYEMMETKKTLEKWGSQVSIPESELKAEREHPSILDMKNLKTLKINPYVGKKLLGREDFVREKLTWISEEYAFKFLPHLKPKPEPK